VYWPGVFGGHCMPCTMPCVWWPLHVLQPVDSVLQLVYTGVVTLCSCCVVIFTKPLAVTALLYDMAECSTLFSSPSLNNNMQGITATRVRLASTPNLIESTMWLAPTGTGIPIHTSRRKAGMEVQELPVGLQGLDHYKHHLMYGSAALTAASVVAYCTAPV
jgi:hypothetical protein